ncbi:hypothetical protein ACVINI_004937 [Rhizobium beringeri]
MPAGRLSEDDPCRSGHRIRVTRSQSWAYAKGVTLDFSRPGKPTDNAFIEAFNGRFRAECLNQHWSLTLADAREKMEDWRRDYNEVRRQLRVRPSTRKDEAVRTRQGRAISTKRPASGIPERPLSMRTKPSAKQQRPAERAGNARFAANNRRDTRHSSTVGINLQTQCRRSTGLPDRHAHRHRQWPQAEPNCGTLTVELSGGVRQAKTAVGTKRTLLAVRHHACYRF